MIALGSELGYFLAVNAQYGAKMLVHSAPAIHLVDELPHILSQVAH